LAEKGCNVVINYTKSVKEAQETLDACRKFGVNAILVQADIASDDDCKRMAKLCFDAFGRLDFLVNNGGVTVLSFSP
jgi:3-oxoacyl-[acyl-carrier protein] reductase